YPRWLWMAKLPENTARAGVQRDPSTAHQAARIVTANGIRAIHGFHGWVSPSRPYPPISTKVVNEYQAATLTPARRCTSQIDSVNQVRFTRAAAASNAQADLPSTT